MHDGQALALGQRLQQLAQVAPGLRGLGIAAGKQLLHVVQRHIERALHRVRAQPVDELVARDGMRPGRHRQVGPVGVALVVHGEQGLLHEVLHFIGPLGQAAAQKGPQVRAQLLQEALVGVAVALQALQQQRAQPLFYLHGVSLAGIRGRCVAGYTGAEK